MVHLGEFNAPLIDGQFQAWELGPVEPCLYHKIKAYGSHRVVNIFSADILDSDTTEFQSIQSVYESLKDAAPGKLVAITHWDDGAWAKNYIPNAYSILISNEDILDEYRKRIQSLS